ncbi:MULTISPECIES: hypothetical protein [Mangrovibacter]|uniref:Uncharacterized protein n=1 Tax=Mangrovibacter plantisponsor TaxID=451513 RepID=A0A317PUH6_9ENTR|nr:MULTISPECIES: hypothetical protein [Mangrovibacter]KEA52781.1 hypothetical protein DT73_11865 [Mangrovibacter sp. MFB070]PWW05868.1 hypothetical protein DES37_112132 [Mangrovibacter plantisponsor]
MFPAGAQGKDEVGVPMKEEQKYETFPLAGLDIRIAKDYDALIVTPQFLATPTDPTVHSDKNFLLSKETALELIELLQNAVGMLNTPPDMKH